MLQETFLSTSTLQKRELGGWESVSVSVQIYTESVERGGGGKKETSYALVCRGLTHGEVEQRSKKKESEGKKKAAKLGGG